MKIITLNTWGGLAGKDLLLSFFEKYKDEVDVFCLQEIWAESYKELNGKSVGGRNLEHDKVMIDGKIELEKVLKNYNSYFRPHFGDHYGLLSFVKKDLKVLDEGEVFVYKEKGYMPEGDVGHHARNIQFLKIESENGVKTVINFHGLWNGKGKGDSDDRLAQSEKIISHIKTIDTPVVLCGDFNLLPSTESLKKIENFGLKNLVKEYEITSTRTSFYTKPERYADYIFVSDDIEVVEFKVLPEEVSDHSPLFLEIE